MGTFAQSPFDDAFADADKASDGVMGVDLIVNGNNVRGVVDVPQLSSKRMPGMDVNLETTTIHLSAEAYLRSMPAKDRFVTILDERMGNRGLRIMRVLDLGGAGCTLECEQTNQRSSTVPGL